MIVLSAYYNESPENYNTILEYLNYVFTFVFTIEVLLKFVAFGVSSIKLLI